MKRVLLTGGTGFVGANLARRLLGDGHDVHLLCAGSHADVADRRDPPVGHPAYQRFTDLAGVTRLVDRIRPAWIFHLAAHGGYSTQTDLGDIVMTNVVGTANLLEACLPPGSRSS